MRVASRAPGPGFIVALVVAALLLAALACIRDRNDIRTPRPTPIPTPTVLREYGPTPYKFAPLILPTPRPTEEK